MMLLIGIANALDLTDRSLPRLRAMNGEFIDMQVLGKSIPSPQQDKTRHSHHHYFFLILLSVEPQLLHFNPYTSDQIVEIIKARLVILSARIKRPINLFDEASIELCARKIASICGDIRRALDICR